MALAIAILAYWLSFDFAVVTLVSRDTADRFMFSAITVAFLIAGLWMQIGLS